MDNPKLGISDFILLTKDRYAYLVWFLLIFIKISVFPLWAGKCINLQILGYLAIVSSNSSGKSLGWGEVNLNLMLGNVMAAFSKRSANLAPGCDLVLKVSPNPAELWWGD